MDFLCDRGVTLMVWAVSALCFLTTMNALAYKPRRRCARSSFGRGHADQAPAQAAKIPAGCAVRQPLRPDGDHLQLHPITSWIASLPKTSRSPSACRSKTSASCCSRRTAARPSSPAKSASCASAAPPSRWATIKTAERTAASFTQNPLNRAYIEPIYRTGDLVRVNERGEMVYVSRKDFQIKHMGHRIELSEIEVQMTAVPGVERALCAYLADKGKILAFYTGEADKAAITGALREILPGYMIPNLFMQVDAMPLNKNGKIDRAALLEQYAAAKAAKKGGSTWITSFPSQSASARRASSLTSAARAPHEGRARHRARRDPPLLFHQRRICFSSRRCAVWSARSRYAAPASWKSAVSRAFPRHGALFRREQDEGGRGARHGFGRDALHLRIPAARSPDRRGRARAAGFTLCCCG